MQEIGTGADDNRAPAPAGSAASAQAPVPVPDPGDNGADRTAGDGGDHPSSTGATARNTADVALCEVLNRWYSNQGPARIVDRLDEQATSDDLAATIVSDSPADAWPFNPVTDVVDAPYGVRGKIPRLSMP